MFFIKETPLFQELLDKGYRPQLKIKDDGYEKLLYVRADIDVDKRMSIDGQTQLPATQLEHQNPTAKKTATGTRFKLTAGEVVSVPPILNPPVGV